ncbi:MAG TPA: methionyl-tRNA formyltransferase [Actinomycetota bacterium]|nr:methionyl-tRNA formyltransferase [Actinomycetota bacterium]
MRVVFLGNDPRSVPPLRAVAGSRHDLALVLTRVPRPAGRKGALRPTAVADASRELSLPLREVETVREGPGLASLGEQAPDVLAVVAYGEILPKAVLETPRVAPVNLHFSLLPRLRGADPVRRAILDGDPVTGVTTIRMDEGLDTGPILLQAEVAVEEDDDAGRLGERLAERGGRLLVETLDRLEAGSIEERPQDGARATVAPKLRPEEEWIDWSDDRERVLRRIRALAPDPGARSTFRGSVLKVLRARAGEARGAPGEIVPAERGVPMVLTATGAVTLDEVLPEGRRRMRGEDWARGQRIEAGERLGS